MPRRTLKEKNIRTLMKISGGKSYAITIPIEHIDELKWKAKQKLVVTRYRDQIIIKDWKPGE